MSGQRRMNRAKVHQFSLLNDLRKNKDGMIVDIFAGGGGASTGLEAALGRPIDLALNHDETAIRVHCANHPETLHLHRGVWAVSPREVIRGRRVRIGWFSPDCTSHSRAKGGKPRRQGLRLLGWAVVRWAIEVKPEVIFVENVREWQDWGPLHATCSCGIGPVDVKHAKSCEYGHPIASRKGETFRQWVAKLEALGYVIEWRVLDASEYGAPTRRKRLFIVARRDGKPIVWPAKTHGPGLLPFHTAAECIDWSIPIRSIFGRKKPLAEKTLWRIAEGLRRFVLTDPNPFIVTIDNRSTGDTSASANEPASTITGTARHVVVAPTLFEVNHGGHKKREHRGRRADEPMLTITAEQRGTGIAVPVLIQTSYGERKGQKARVLDLQEPLGTVVSQGQKHSIVTAHLEKFADCKTMAECAAFLNRHFGSTGQGANVAAGLDSPVPTITARDHHSLTAATLVKMRGTTGQKPAQDMREPVPTIAAQGNHLYEVRAFLSAYYGSDGTSGQSLHDPMRTVTAKERLGLVTIHGTDYQIVDIGFRMLEPDELARAQFGRFAADYDLSGAKTKKAKVKLIGNSVCPEMAEAMARANLPDLAPERMAA